MQLAVNLSTRTEESSWRTSVSRSYYSVFLVAREKIQQRVPTAFQAMVRLGDIHHKVIEMLKSLGFPHMADKLDALRRMRGKADYDLITVITQPIAGKALTLANNLHSLLQSV
ncbi:MAG: hypothetical protein HMLIMOIP_001694 [Candidatus Nitrosomirales archaeon]